MNSTGGGIYKQLSLSPLEEAPANFLQFEKQLNPGGNVKVVSILPQYVFNVNITVLEGKENMPTTSATVCERQETKKKGDIVKKNEISNGSKGIIPSMIQYNKRTKNC